APAGFGKTTLLADWLAAASETRSVAWLSLDQHDNNAAVFWTYVIAALQTVAPEAGASTLALLQSPQPPSINAILPPLLNELGGAGNEVLLVLDDYHVIEDPEIQAGVGFLVEHQPPRLHLVIASRADPALPLARLRARGELTELRAADLRFRPEEAAAYLNEVMGLELTADDIAALEARTEGWIAALQLAALSMQGREDVSGFIAGFTGDDRYIVDYLVEEVLQRQPAPVREFLLQTAILDRLCGPLCDAVTGHEGGQTMLEALERGNVFVVHLDDRRRWYRYHHLFADVLRAHLIDEQPDRVHDLHRRASAWFEQNGERPEAIRHALAAEDFGGAADLIELSLSALLSQRQEAPVREWLRRIPADVIRVRPVLGVGYVGVLLQSGDLPAAERQLAEVERQLASTASGQSIYQDEVEFRRLPGQVSIYRSAFARLTGNLPDTVRYAQAALDVMSEDDIQGRGAALSLLGLALWATGDIANGRRTFAEGIALVQRAGYVPDSLSGSIAIAEMSTALGHLNEALQVLERSLSLASEHGPPAPLGTADVHVAISEVYRERNDLDAALEHLATSRELGETAALRENRYRWFVAMAGVETATGHYGEALDLLRQAEALYSPGFNADTRPIAALRARVWLMQGKVADALAWARERGLTIEDDAVYAREFEHLTLVNALLAQAGADGDATRDVLAFLERLLQAAEANGRNGSVVQVLVLQALAHRAAGDMPAALQSLRRALSLAEVEGYVRVFVDERAPMAALLEAAVQRGIAVSYARRLLDAFGVVDEKPSTASASTAPQQLLSERELDVLRLLRGDLDGPEIARELVVSLNTMRTHTKSIYSKLGVSTRRAAVRRAEELNLI
ncbi:MAG: LuxR C-terminal-related transcriptional regulator, partial [Dehalococcoidia bacterium]